MTNKVKNMDLETDPRFISQLKREKRELLSSRISYTLIAACFIYPAFWFLDRVTAPGEHLETFLYIRIGVVITYLMGLAVVNRYPSLVSVGLVFVSALGISIMTPYIGGFENSYYVGVLMALVVGGLFLPWSFLETLICGLLIIVSYFGINFIFAFDSSTPAFAVAAPFFFIVGTFIFTIWANRDKEKMRRKELLQRMQMEQVNDDLKALDEAKTRFFSNVSHELRSPLMLILGPLESILGGRESMDSRSLMEAMEANARRLLRQVNSLLDFAKLDAGKLQCHYSNSNLGAELNSLVKAAIPMAQRRGIELRIDDHEGFPDNLLDFAKVETIAANLISNALKFTPEDGSIVVGLSYNKDKVFFQVKDSGAGIPKDQLDSIFERFLQVDDALSRNTGGTGLGLAMVKELTELQKGRVTIESEVGVGTTFTIELPRNPDLSSVERRNSMGRRRVDQLAASRTQSMLGKHFHEKGSKETLLSDVAAATLEIQAKSGETDEAIGPEDASHILLVEDNPDLRTFVARSLSEKYRVTTANDGLEGLETAVRVKPDLIISDVMMPRMDGYEMCRRLRENSAFEKVPIILVTAEYGTDKLVHGLEAGANDYIAKPFEMRELDARVDTHLRTQQLERDLEERDARLSAIGRTTSTIVHDLTNPLNSILGFSQLAKDDIGELASPSVSQCLDSVIAESNRLSLMITEVMDFSRGRIHDLRLEKTKLKAFFGLISKSLHQQLDDRDIALIIEESDEELSVKLDRYRSQRVIENLIKNSWEAIETLGDERNQRHIWISTKRKQDATIIRIADDGPGVKGEMLKMMFKAFASGGKSRGVGLGLATALALLQAQGGDIQYESNAPEGGAAFILTFPQVAPSVQRD